MLKQRIISTLVFFDLQDYPLTLLELHKFLLAPWPSLEPLLEQRGAVLPPAPDRPGVSAGKVLECLESECAGVAENTSGFYHLPGRQAIAEARISNYLHAIRRERLVRRYAWALRYLPFVRAAAVAGSQSMGQQKATSDIDMFVVTHPEFIWLARIFITGYFQLFGVRRHGAKIADRFCLNHYLAGEQPLLQRDIYNAMEYLRFRPLFGGDHFRGFYECNLDWLQAYFPNFVLPPVLDSRVPAVRAFLEKFFLNPFGRWLNAALGRWQLGRIRRGEYVVASETELSFHSLARKAELIRRFADLQKNALEPLSRP